MTCLFRFLFLNLDFLILNRIILVPIIGILYILWYTKLKGSDYMGFYISSVDNKQHINLSDFAYNTLEEDIYNFYSPGIKGSFAGFLNQIFSSYHERSNASISIRLEQLKKEYLETLKLDKKTSLNIDSRNEVIARLLEVNKRRLLSDALSYTKGNPVKFRINNDNALILNESNEDSYYEGSLGNYFKAVLEDYTRQPVFERELIFFSSFVNQIELAIKLQCELKVTIESGKNYFIKPFKIVIDHSSTFNYLIGYSYQEKESIQTTIRISSFRLSRIKHLRLYRSRSGFISESDKKALSNVLNSKGPQFLSYNDIDIVVFLTSEGIKKYNNQINLRPRYQKIEGSYYYFNCSESQILYYFFKFGKDALIISPVNLQSRFKRAYKKAYDDYEELELSN